MKDRELMQQALDALKVMRPACFAENTLKTADTAITALRDRLAQPHIKVEGPLHVVCQCDKCKFNYSVEELPPLLTKGQAWQKWWYETRGKHMVAGGAHPMEWAMYDAFNSGWDAAKQNSEKD
jgi:hypothetical protein